MKTIITLAAAAMITALTATAATAQISTTVSYADLDVTTTAGQVTLGHRVANAASHVCDVSNGDSDLGTRVAAKKCRAEAIKNAMQAFAEKNAPKYASR